MKTYIVSGHYGSGKTEVSLNLCLYLKKSNKNVTIADLDVINPYFRSRQKIKQLNDSGINVIAGSLNSNTGQDIPAVSYAFISNINKGENVVLDLGGGLQGTKILAPCYDAIKNNDYEFLCVLNAFRSETDTAEKMINFINQINLASPIKISGLVNNGHMLSYTQNEHILHSQKEILKISKMLNLPISFTLLQNNIYEDIKNEIISNEVIIFHEPQIRENWQN